ncbi:hypothetical protein LXA43DRAFT_721262 [Ganoderma leucocontextum]|nr:hypothetical protein LXA43DRAFT_721262 [Ganoderma leucocontextum]
MSQPETAPLNMSLAVLFAPADGRAYRPEDKDRVFAQQPLEGPSLPGYLIPSRSSTLKPPTLVYGWRLGHDKLMQIALDSFPQVVRYRSAPATLGLGNEENEHYTEEDWAQERPNIAETIFDYDFIVAIREYLGIGPEGDNLFNIDVLYDSQREAEFGLTVGSNYLKVLRKDFLQKLEALIAPDEPAMWWLHCKKWMWRRAVPQGKSKTKTKYLIRDPKLVVTLEEVTRSVS